jgi:hypothetical protein
MGHHGKSSLHSQVDCLHNPWRGTMESFVLMVLLFRLQIEIMAASLKIKSLVPLLQQFQSTWNSFYAS